jgi:hypothetical protein
MGGDQDNPVIVELSTDLKWCSLENHPLSGCTMFQWLRIWWANHREIDYYDYWPRILFLTVLSLFNTFFATLDFVFFQHAVLKTPIPSRPIFVLGQPRSGTTLVYNLLAEDCRSFGAPSTLQVGFPSCFLTIEPFVGWPPLDRILSQTRPMDNIPLNWYGTFSRSLSMHGLLK